MNPHRTDNEECLWSAIQSIPDAVKLRPLARDTSQTGPQRFGRPTELKFDVNDCIYLYLTCSDSTSTAGLP